MAQTNIHNRQVFAMDNIDVLRAINSASVDLIYLDPPFNKKKEFVSPLKKDFFKDMAEEQKTQIKETKKARFKDIFTEDDAKLELALEIKERHEKLYNLLNSIKQIEGGKSFNFWYLVYMAIRLIECQRVLKKTGSIYLHCDPTMSHYLKLVMDYIFGESNFRNEIIWSYQGTGQPGNAFKRKHDIVLFYGRTRSSYFSEKGSSEPIGDFSKSKYTQKDEKGLYKNIRHPDGNVHKQYIRSHQRMRDVWEIPIINAMAKERTGYPTQKPLALLKRIINASSNEGDMVLDPFCGCATTPVAAEILNRQWVGVDLEPRSYHLVVQRLNKSHVQKELAPNKRGDKCDWDKLCSPESEPPQRAIDPQDRRHVYIVSNPAWDGKFKIGVAGDLDERLKDYQTYDPFRSYKYEHHRETERYFECERHILKTFKLKPEKDANGEPKVKGEWVVGDLDRIRNAIDNFIDQGG